MKAYPTAADVFDELPELTDSAAQDAYNNARRVHTEAFSLLHMRCLSDGRAKEKPFGDATAHVLHRSPGLGTDHKDAMIPCCPAFPVESPAYHDTNAPAPQHAARQELSQHSADCFTISIRGFDITERHQNYFPVYQKAFHAIHCCRKPSSAELPPEVRTIAT